MRFSIGIAGTAMSLAAVATACAGPQGAMLDGSVGSPDGRMGGAGDGAADGERILFVRPATALMQPFPAGDVFMVRPDGTDERRLTTSGDMVFATWSYDRGRIALTRVALSGQPDIWVMNPDGSALMQVTHQGGLMPSWSPDGMLIEFMAPSETGEGSLWTVRPDGSEPTLLRGNAYFGSYSPDGTKIVYTGKVQGQDRLHNETFVMDADGSNSTQLTFADSDLDFPDTNAPSWSPDGRMIAFFCGHEGDLPPAELDPYYHAGMQQVCVMNASDGSQRRQLTFCTECGSDNPGWSPDGRVFFDRGTFSSGVSTFIIDADGTREEPLLDVSLGAGRLPWR